MENENSIVIVDLETKKRTAPNGTEYWMGRTIQQLLGYQDWRNFTNAIDKAKVACDGSGVESSNHFVETTEMVSIGSGAKAKKRKLLPYPVCVLPNRNECRSFQDRGGDSPEILCYSDAPPRADRCTRRQRIRGFSSVSASGMQTVILPASLGNLGFEILDFSTMLVTKDCTEDSDLRTLSVSKAFLTTKNS